MCNEDPGSDGIETRMMARIMARPAIGRSKSFDHTAAGGMRVRAPMTRGAMDSGDDGLGRDLQAMTGYASIGPIRILQRDPRPRMRALRPHVMRRLVTGCA